MDHANKIDKQNVEDVVALTPMQTGMLFHYLSNPGNTTYFVQMCYELQGDTLVQQLAKEAWGKLALSNEMLRTVFRWEKLEKPLQIVLKNHELPIFEYDLSIRCDTEKKKALANIKEKDRDLGIDIRIAPLRVTFCKMSNEVLAMIVSYHHIIIDGWSAGILLQEFSETYLKLKKGEQVAGSAKTRFKEYVKWLQKQDAMVHQEFWRDYLDGFEEKTGLPTERIKADNEFASTNQKFTISDQLAEKAKDFAKSQKTTLAVILYSAWGLLLQRYNSTNDVLFGTTISGRSPELRSSDRAVGLFVQTPPLRVRTDREDTIQQLLERVHADLLRRENVSNASLVDIIKYASLEVTGDLFDSVVIVENYPLDPVLTQPESDLRVVGYTSYETIHYDLTLEISTFDGLCMNLIYNPFLFRSEIIQQLAYHYQNILTSMVLNPQSLVTEIVFLSQEERKELLVDFNQTFLDYDKEITIYQQFLAQVQRTPHELAIVCKNSSYTYDKLQQKANRIAHYLIESANIRPGDLIGVMMERTSEMIVSMLAIMAAGATYVPLDPSYPSERIHYIVEESKLRAIIAETALIEAISAPPNVVNIAYDNLQTDFEAMSSHIPEINSSSRDLAYVLFTSGSTGKPKGVMVNNRNVVNFFAAMDQIIMPNTDDVMLSVTTISFDISVLELFWTLTRGIKIVLKPEGESYLDNYDRYLDWHGQIQMDFSVFFFSSYEHGKKDGKYEVLKDVARFADKHGFSAIWTPERHFHEFGGLYPNPSVTSAALAMITERIQIRSGSVVSPLHDALRIAEEWSVVDNLSQGRVGISFASGWHADDFVLNSDQYENRFDRMFTQIEEVKRLWSGEKLTRVNGIGNEVDVCVYPRPLQEELPIWVTAAESKRTFIRAGQIGAHVLTHLLSQNIEDLAECIRLYRQALKDSGFAPEHGRITLMLHTFIGEDMNSVKEHVKEPFCNYLRSSVSLVRNIADTYGVEASQLDDEAVMQQLMDIAFERFWQTSALLGTPESCGELVKQLYEIGVNEIACLIDFGVKPIEMMESLKRLAKFKEQYKSMPEQTRRGKANHLPITMMQSTPSRLRMMTADRQSQNFLASLRTLLVGGEAFPINLVKTLREQTGARILNMYGPTETTVWSSCYELPEHTLNVPIGHPIANTQIYVLDERLEPVPKGAVGEIYIGGDGVANGYLHREELTNERFVTHAWKETSQTRLYRTGDLGRRLQDGTIDFRGRKDHQIKIRGHRIELGEVEKAFARFENLAEVAVINYEDEQGHQYLAAYIVSDLKLDIVELRMHAEKLLPRYMIPNLIVQLPKLPLTPNGKINYKELPGLNAYTSSSEQHESPRSKVEAQLLEIWSNVLGVQQVGIHDNIFNIGGNSVLLIQVHGRLDKLYPDKVKITDLFAYPTIAKLAEFLEGTERASFVKVPLHQLKLSNNYFVNGNAKNETTLFQTALPHESYERINHLCLADEVELSDLMAALFLYFMYEKSEEEEFYVHTIMQRQDYLRNVKFSAALVESDDFLTFTKQLGKKVTESDEFYIQHVQYAVDELVEREPNTIIPLLMHKGLSNTQLNLFNTYDMVMEFDDTGNELRLLLEFNNGRLRKDLMRQWLNEFIQLLQLVAAQYQKQSSGQEEMSRA